MESGLFGILCGYKNPRVLSSFLISQKIDIDSIQFPLSLDGRGLG